MPLGSGTRRTLSADWAYTELHSFREASCLRRAAGECDCAVNGLVMHRPCQSEELTPPCPFDLASFPFLDPPPFLSLMDAARAPLAQLSNSSFRIAGPSAFPRLRHSARRRADPARVSFHAQVGDCGRYLRRHRYAGDLFRRGAAPSAGDVTRYSRQAIGRSG